MDKKQMSQDELKKFIKENEPHPLHDSARSNDLGSFVEIQSNAGFSELLFSFIKGKNISEVECYKKAGITPQHFSKIRSERNYTPTKGTVISLAVSLKLNLEQTKKLLRSAGLAFTHSSKSDLIVEYFIINEKWNLFQINEALDSYGLEPLK
ncbi:MAG: hypothetical protein SO135_08130 [Sphaerochaetaceae bacterium]|jgi:hypothetical protein|nr:hypothetical protein [Sphaerochaetaceae bacterium]NLY07724.1 hypothetical protein [Spirochaetales bacterium]